MCCFKSYEYNNLDDQRDDLVLVKFTEIEDEVYFYVSKEGPRFSFLPSKSIQDIKNDWFDDYKPNLQLCKALSDLSYMIGKDIPPEEFINKIKKIYFHYSGEKIVPYRYSLKSLK